MNAEGLVAGFIAAIERGDIEAAMGYLAPDCEYDNVPMSKAVGHDEIRAVDRLAISFVARGERGHLRAERHDVRGPALADPSADAVDCGSSIERVDAAPEDR